MKTTLKSTLLLAICLLSIACAKNPVTGEQDFVTVSEATEIAQGTQYHQSIIAQYGVYDDPALQAYVNRLGQQLAKLSHRSHLKFTFTVLDSPEINAFALPGGYVYITRGIMAYLNSEAELAGVLGHEIGHVTARHSVRQQSGQFASSLFNVVIAATTGSPSLGNLSQQLSTGIVRGYGRDHELEADKLGAIYLHNSNYDPDNMLQVIGVLKDQEVYEKALAKKQNREANIYHGVFSTHPKNDQRLRTVVQAAKKLSAKSYINDNEDTYLSMINGMTWGPSVKQGLIRDNRFAHPGLAFAINLPANWQHHNSAEFLASFDPKSGAQIQISIVPKEANESLAALLQRLIKNNSLEVSIQPYGATALTQVKPGSGSLQPARISAIQLSAQQVLLLLGTANEKAFDAIDRQIIALNQTFKRLSSDEIAAIKTPKLRVIDNDKNATFQSIANSSALKDNALDTIQLLNQSYPDGKIGPLKQIKTVSY